MPQKLEATSLCIELSQELGEYKHSQEFLCGRALPFLLWEAEAWRWEGPELAVLRICGIFFPARQLLAGDLHPVPLPPRILDASPRR